MAQSSWCLRQPVDFKIKDACAVWAWHGDDAASQGASWICDAAVTKAECVGPDPQVIVRQLPHGRSMISPWIKHHLPRVSRKFRMRSTGSDLNYTQVKINTFVSTVQNNSVKIVQISMKREILLEQGCNSLCVHHMLTFYPWPVRRCSNHRQPSVTGCIRV